MENQKNVLLEKASQKLETLLELKNFAVKLADYELIKKCREIELEKFPITQEQTEAKDEADKLNLLFRMVELNIDEKFCYRIARAFELYKKKKGKFDIKDASKIIMDSERLFQRK